jgi:outer membrane lipoprotein-sorting protein
MKRLVTWSAVILCAVVGTAQAQTQTADEVVEKHLAAMGGRAALAKLDSRTATGTITVSTQGVDLSGSVEVYAKAPNKSRSFVRLDLSAVGAGEVTVDQRCDGKSAWVSNSMQGDREITGGQLQNMLNARFPSALLAYKEAGAKVELLGKDKVGDRAVFVLQHTSKAGPVSRAYVDAETYLPLRNVTKIDVPEAGGEMEQTTDLGDYRAVDGVQVPFSVTNTNAVQTVTMRLAKVEHNKPIDETMFSRPAGK